MRSDFPIASMIVGLALSASGSAQIPKDSTPHSVSFVAVEPDVVEEVLDWGGSGPTIALLAGLGFTPRVFDSFASRFIDRYHVVGITRRGFGASSRPEDGYDTARLAQDILVVLDRLNIREVILSG